MDTDGWRSAVRRDVERFAVAVEGRADRPVPTCPEWKVRDLAHHMIRVLEFWTGIATGAVTDPAAWDREPPLPPDGDLAPRLRAAGAAADVIYTIDPATPRWSWSPHQHVGFIQRRMAHETAIHLQDALLATTGAEPVDRELAVDGVSEFIDTFLATEPDRVAAGPQIDLQAVDTDDRWRIGSEDGLCDVSVEATASDLFLLLWRRPTAVAPVVDGDDDVWDAFLEAVKIE